MICNIDLGLCKVIHECVYQYRLQGLVMLYRSFMKVISAERQSYAPLRLFLIY
jgi:hypothetical protein